MAGNGKLLLLSLGLAAVVVILYNVHISQIRNEQQSDMMKLLRYKLDKKAGEQISEKDDIEVISISKSAADGLRSVVTSERISDYAGKTLSRPVIRGQWIQVDDIMETTINRPSIKIPPGMVLVTLPLDPKMIPGKMLRFGDKINVLAALPASPTNKTQYKTYHIIDGLSVHGIGGRTLSDRPNTSRVSDDDGVSSYQNIQVEVAKDLDTKLYNVISHAKGQQVWIQVRYPLEPKSQNDGKINEQVRQFAETVGLGGSSGSGEQN